MPLIRRRQEARLPVRRTGVGTALLIQHDHEARQVLVLGAQTVGDPRADARIAHLDGAGVPLVVRNHVVVREALAGVNECQVIHHGRDIREDFRDPRARLSVLLEAEGALHQRPGIALPDLDLAVAFHRHPVVFFQRRLVLEGVDVADAAAHEQRDHRFRARLEVRRLGQQKRIAAAGRAACTMRVRGRRSAASRSSWLSRSSRARPPIPMPASIQNFRREMNSRFRP